MDSIGIPTRVLWYDFETIFGRYTCPFCLETHERDFTIFEGTQGLPEGFIQGSRFPGATFQDKFIVDYPVSEDGKSFLFDYDETRRRHVARDYAAEVSQSRSEPVDLSSRMQTLNMEEDRPALADGFEAVNHRSKTAIFRSSPISNTYHRLAEDDTECKLINRGFQGDCRLFNLYLKAFKGEDKILVGAPGLNRLMCVLAYAAFTGNLPILLLLLRDGADPNRRSMGGDTPLIWAVRGVNYSAAYLLLRHGADRSLRNEAGETAEDVAQKITYALPRTSLDKIIFLLRTE